jgi:serine/threonine protein kinase/tetratricopeptide (TPR) repeat protein
MPADPNRVKAVFLAAAESPDEVAREACLERECGPDAELRARVEALLAAHDQPGGLVPEPTALPPGVPSTVAFLPGAPGTATHAPHDPDATTGPERSLPGGALPSRTEGIGSILEGRYTLIELIGEGGMGSVYLARQTEPVKRQVAVKLIKSGMDSKQVLARFEAERQALALMDHPNIARVYDGGTTPTGQPFFVMELVRGVAITQYCDERRLTPKARLELFVPVCQAVQHAHQKGIIHRDIKPGNVLVIEVDGRPVPKVIDFGVAKATEQKLIDHSFSDTGAIVGTPVYMSPEQADPSSMDIDTRTDVYALGVMLYELLAGSPPFDASQFRRGAILAMLRMVRETDPPKPSTKAGSAVELPNIAASRALEPKQLVNWLRGDIDWIVMKSLEKDRNRRYETANGLARDIERLLADEVVEARPPSTAYRLRKFVRRNKARVIAAAVLLLVLVGGVVGTALGWIEARKQRDAADLARADAVAEAGAKERARLGEAEQRRNAEQANQQAFDALKSFTDELMGKLLGSRDKLTETDKAILRNAQKQWEVFARSKGDSPEARVIRSEGAAELALVQYKLGLHAEAEANDRLALELRAGLAAEFPDVPRYRLKQGMSHQNLGASLRGGGNRAEAEANFQQAVGVFERLAADFPEVQQYRQRLGRSLTSLGNAKRGRADWAGAERHYRDALALQKKLAADSPDTAGYRDDLVGSHSNLAFTLKRAGKPAEAEHEYREALAILQKLAIEFPAEAAFRLRSANLGRELGVLLYDGGNDEAGAKLFPGAIDTLRQLAAEFPSIPTYRYDLSRCRRDFGKVLGYLNKRIESTEQFGEAIRLGENLVRDHPTVLPYQHELGLSYYYFANMLCDTGTPAEGMEWYGKAIGTLTAAYERDRLVVLTQSALHKCHADRARAFARQGKFADALPDWDRALSLCPPEMRNIYRFERVDSWLRSGQVAAAIAEVDELATIESANPAHWFNFARLYAIASARIEGRKDEYAGRAVELLSKAVALGYKDSSRLAKEADLRPLRDRDDFKQLLAGLEKKLPSKHPSAPPTPRQ